MSNPPNNETKMSNPPVTGSKMTRCKLMQDLWIPSRKEMVKAGQEIDLNEDEVKEYCDKRFSGPYKHTGETEVDNPAKHSIRRAIRVEEIQAAEKLKKLTG